MEDSVADEKETTERPERKKDWSIHFYTLEPAEKTEEEKGKKKRKNLRVQFQDNHIYHFSPPSRLYIVYNL